MFSHVKDIMSWKVFPSKNRHDNERANVSEGSELEIPFLEKIIWTTKLNNFTRPVETPIC